MYVAPLRPSTQFYSRFSLPRGRSNRFGSQPCDSGHFHTPHLVTCVLVAFAPPASLRVRLATQLHSLARYSKRTVHNQSFSCAPHYKYSVSDSFHTLSRVLFSVPSRYLFAIGLSSCLALGVSASRLPASYPRGGTLVVPVPFNRKLRGSHPLRPGVPAEFIYNCVG